MRKNLSYLLVLCILLTLSLLGKAQQICNANGNLFVFANYDGGVLNIDVNVNIPNIKIGICTYEPTTINITGAFASNVTEVRYAGYVATNNHHCTNSPSTTTITGVPSNITTVNFLPPSTLNNPNGYQLIVCAYSCDVNSNQGGCNTADQVKDYFQTTMGATLYSYYTQYGCWSTTPYQLNAGGNCCPAGGCALVANAGPDQMMCAGSQVTLSGSATGGATTYSWSPTTGLSNPNAATTTASPSTTTTYTLTATDGGVCTSTDVVTVTVGNPTASLASFPAICADNGPLTLTGGQPSGGVYSGSGVSSGTFSASITGAGTFPITYTVTDISGCTATATSNIVVNPQPVVSQTPIGPFCQNDPPVTLASGSPTGGSYSGSGVTNGIFSPAAGVGSHTIVYDYVDQNGCSNSAVQNVTVFANPAAPTLQYAWPNLFTTAAGDSVQWFYNGLHLLTNGSTTVPTLDGSYTAILWSNGCPSPVSGSLDVTIVGLENGLGNVAVQAWPNPAGDELHVALEGIQFEATLVDLLGREVRAAQSMQSSGTLSLRGLSKGVYTLRIRCEFGNMAVRVLKD
jgi:Secretion system C-terminal sorting domain